MATSTQTSATSSPPSSPTPSSLPTFTPSSHLHLTKLSRSNYPLWRAQLVPYLRGQGVLGYVDGTIKQPSATTVIDGITTSNPDYEHWVKQDALILSTITSSLTDDILRQVYTAATSADIWRALETSFASQSRAQLVHLRTKLASTRKGTMTIHEYFMTIKTITDELHMAGHPLTDDDIIAYLLAGLGQDYDPLVAVLSARSEITIDEVFSLLLTTEARLNHHAQTPLQPAILPAATPAAHVTGYRPSQSRGRSNSAYQQPSSGPPNSSTSGPHPNRGRGRGNRGRGRGTPPSTPGAQCQLCEKFGHTVHECWYRFDNTFTPPRNTRNAQANIATHNSSTDWVADTGATHHITNNLSNLNLSADSYDGPDKIHIGDGSGLLGPRPPQGLP